MDGNFPSPRRNARTLTIAVSLHTCKLLQCTVHNHKKTRLPTELKTNSPTIEKAHDLLLNMLSVIRDSEDTLLHSEIDSQAVAGPAWESFLHSLNSTEARELEDWPKIESLLSSFITQALTAPGDSESHAPSEQRSNIRAVSPAAWLSQIFDQMQSVDYRAIEILSLLLENYDSRYITENLDIGLRCVQHITADMRATWHHSISGS